jgi:periplasmic copper chaperone A
VTKVALVALLSLAFATVARAEVHVEGAWVRGTVSGQKTTGAFMQLRSMEGGALLGAETAVAGVTEIHEMRMEGNIMRMRPVQKIELPAGRTVDLKPGGYHVMLIDLKRPLKTGESVAIKLKLEDKDKKVRELVVKAEVRDLTAPGNHKKH